MVEGITKKSSKKAKETAKLVKKLDDKQVENMRDILNKIFIMRHKVRMLWFKINADDAQIEEKEQEEDEDEEEIPEEVKQAKVDKKLEYKEKLRKLAR